MRRTLRSIVPLAAGGLLLASTNLLWAQTAPVVSTASAPPGTEALDVKWVSIAAPDVGVMLAAVARPPGPGPFPVVILLHGTHGFAQEYVRLARDLAAGGVMAVAACWFRGSAGAGVRFVTPIACPEGPAMVPGSSPEAGRIAGALGRAARMLPDARAERIAVFGHSRGGGAVLSHLLSGSVFQAAVLNSTGYPIEFASRVAPVDTPILMLHGTADSPANGGGPNSKIDNARAFEAARRAAGKPVEAVYYDDGRHDGIFTSASQYRDEVQRILGFLLRHLRD